MIQHILGCFLEACPLLQSLFSSRSTHVVGNPSSAIKLLLIILPTLLIASLAASFTLSRSSRGNSWLMLVVTIESHGKNWPSESVSPHAAKIHSDNAFKKTLPVCVCACDGSALACWSLITVHKAGTTCSRLWIEESVSSCALHDIRPCWIPGNHRKTHVIRGLRQTCCKLLLHQACHGC